MVRGQHVGLAIDLVAVELKAGAAGQDGRAGGFGRGDQRAADDAAAARTAEEAVGA